MTGTWWTRFSVIAVTVLWGAWMVAPTFVGESTQAILEAQAAAAKAAAGATAEGEEAPTVEGPWWVDFLPDGRISLGLDLQGGIDMTLTVEVDEAVVSSVHRDVAPLKTLADDDGLSLADVRRLRGESILLIKGEEGVPGEEIRRFMSKRFNTYEFLDVRNVDGREYHAFGVLADQAKYIGDRAVEQALETLRSRIDETGVKEPSIVLKGGNRINVQLPGIENIEEAVAAIGTTAVLEFMLVDEEADEIALDRGLLEAESALTPEQFADDFYLSDWMARQGRINDKSRVMFEYEDRGEAGQIRTRAVVVRDRIILTGDDVNDASVAMNQYNEPYVGLEFKPRGGKLFCDITTENVGRRFAIVLDNKVRSAPVIREAICGGRASIEMGVQDYQQGLKEASVLALVLRTGALPAPVSIGDVRTVGASMGADAIAAGKLATMVGGALVVVFMVLFYRLAGVVSCVALGANMLLVMALLAAAGATLTLPGIAGIALTIGMAVDCNIIVYERIREELRLGKNSRSAVDSGFSSALTAVLDANITTFIAGVVLYTYGTGPIKGFSVTLMIGIITTLFTGIFVSRTMMNFITRKASARLSI
jgi:preprotein translocase subunit SecD